jgi:hypothetical protein
MATPHAQMSPDQRAASAAAVRILREIVDYQRRLRRLSVHESSGEQSYLIEAYRRAIKLRQQLLEDLPKPREAAPDPWRRD